MKRMIALGSVLFLPLIFHGAEVRSQDVPAPPAPPGAPAIGVMGRAMPEGEEMPEPPEPPGPQEFFMGEGGSHLGVALADVTPDLARELKLPAEAGAIVKDVKQDSPASKAGLEKNDVILQFAGERVRSVAQLRRLVRETPPGRTVNIEISRGGQTRTLSAKLEASGNQQFSFHMPVVPRIEVPEFNFHFVTHGPSLGISGDELTTQLANYFGVKQGKGILVREVVVGSAAEKAGLKAGDVIVQVDGKPVSSVGELRSALASATTEEKRKVNLTIVRDRHEQTVSVELEKPAPLEPRKLAENAVRQAQERLQKYQNELQRELQAKEVSLEEIQRQLQRQQFELQKAERELQRQVREQIRVAIEKERVARKLSGAEGVI